MDGSIIAIIVSAVFIVLVALFFGIKAIVKKCKEEIEYNELFNKTRTVENAQINNPNLRKEDNQNVNTRSIDENNDYSSEESSNNNSSSKSNSQSDKSLSSSSNSITHSVLESNETTKSTSTEITSTESSDKITTNNNYNYTYNYHPTFTSNYHSDSSRHFSSDSSRHFSDDNSSHFSPEEKSSSFHNYRREPERNVSTTTRKSNSTKIAHCCNKCRNICAVCHKDAHSSGYRAYICSSCSDDLRNIHCPVCGGRMNGSDQARMCFDCYRKHGMKCFKCD